MSQMIAYLRKLRRSLGPDSYFRYKRDRNYDRREAQRAREHTHAVKLAGEKAERDAERKRGYRKRYERETAGRAGEDPPGGKVMESQPESARPETSE